MTKNQRNEKDYSRLNRKYSDDLKKGKTGNTRKSEKEQTVTRLEKRTRGEKLGSKRRVRRKSTSERDFQAFQSSEKAKSQTDLVVQIISRGKWIRESGVDANRRASLSNQSKINQPKVEKNAKKEEPFKYRRRAAKESPEGIQSLTKEVIRLKSLTSDSWKRRGVGRKTTESQSDEILWVCQPTRGENTRKQWLNVLGTNSKKDEDPVSQLKSVYMARFMQRWRSQVQRRTMNRIGREKQRQSSKV